MDPFEDVLSIEDVDFSDMTRLITRSNTEQVVMPSNQPADALKWPVKR